MYEELGHQFHVSRVAGLLRAVCVRCGSFVGASPHEQLLRIAAAAHACKDDTGKFAVQDGTLKSASRK